MLDLPLGLQGYGLAGTGRDAQAAAVAVQPIHHVAGRKGRGRRPVDGRPESSSRFPVIRDRNRADRGALATEVTVLGDPRPGLLDHHPVVAQVAADLGDGAVGEHRDAGVKRHRGHHGVDEAHDALALGKGLVEPVGHASQHRGALHQGHGNPGVGDVQGGPKARRAPADHQGGPGQGHLALGQGDRVPHLGQPHADQLQGLHQRCFRFPGVHPGAVLPEVDDFQEIGIDAVFGQQAPKGGLVELGGAGRHHQAVQTELLDILGDILLARLGARVEMIPAHRDPRQTPGLLRQGLRADDPGNVVPAVADVEADAGVSLIVICKPRSLPDRK